MRGVFHGMTATAWVLAVLLCAAPPVEGQTPAAAPAYAPPRTAFGHPDLQGIWQVMNTAAYHRRIPLADRARPGLTARFWMGIPRGRWDADTLVVESTDFNGRMWLDSVDYEVTIDDPATFRRPLKLNAPLRRVGTGGGGGGGNANNSNDPYAVESWEHACHEGHWNHIEGAEELGFKWFLGAKPPQR